MDLRLPRERSFMSPTTRPALIIAVFLFVGCSRAPERAARPAGELPTATVRWPDALPRAFARAERFEVLALDPFTQSDTIPDNYYGWRVVGRAAVTDRPARARLIESLRRSLRQPGVEPGFCFHPRHGLSVTRAGRTVDLVICFECSRFESYENGEQTDFAPVGGAPEPLFNDLLRAACASATGHPGWPRRSDGTEAVRVD
jgi:hypothetical protein